MSTCDVVNQVGGSPANFLDIGGGASAEVMANALEVINTDEKVRSIFINIFGGITRGEEVANGIVQALDRVALRSPIVIRLDGTNAEEGRAILAPHESDRLISKPTMLDAAKAAVALAEGGLSPMAIFVDENTKVLVQGLTGRPGQVPWPAQQGVRHAGRRRCHPRQGRPGRRGHPRVRQRGRRGEGHRGRRQLRQRAAEGGARRRSSRRPAAGVPFIVCITEGVPAHDEARVFNTLKRDHPGVRLLGPNCPGIISPGKCNIGITPGEIAMAGGPVGIVSRSGTLTYQALYELKQKGIGVTTCVGIGGDPVPGTSFIDCLEASRPTPTPRPSSCSARSVARPRRKRPTGSPPT